MQRRAPTTDRRARTRIRCDRTEGYGAKSGAHYYEFCPYCGHRTDEGHEIQIEILGR